MVKALKMIGLLILLLLITLIGSIASQFMKSGLQESRNESDVSKDFKLSVDDIDSIMANTLNEMAKNFPTRIDKDTEVFSATYVEGNLQMNYRLINYKASDLDENILANSVYEDLVKRYCTEEDTKLLRERPNSSIQSKYYGNDNNLILNIRVDEKNCKNS